MLRKLVNSRLLRSKSYFNRPLASLVVCCHLRQRKYPHWTSFFVRYRSIQEDNWGRSHYNFDCDGVNYHILRTGCWPYVKYHCTRRTYQRLAGEDIIFSILKLINLGIPCLAYGLAAIFLIKVEEQVVIDSTLNVPIYFLEPEVPDAQF